MRAFSVTFRGAEDVSGSLFHMVPHQSADPCQECATDPLIVPRKRSSKQWGTGKGQTSRGGCSWSSLRPGSGALFPGQEGSGAAEGLCARPGLKAQQPAAQRHSHVSSHLRAISSSKNEAAATIHRSQAWSQCAKTDSVILPNPGRFIYKEGGRGMAILQKEETRESERSLPEVPMRG